MNAGLLDDRVDRYLDMGSVRLLIGDESRGRTAERKDGSGRSADYQCFGADDRPRRAAIVTRSGSESAFILRMT
jgi:hypothetical protein